MDRHPISGSFGTSCGKAKAEVEVEAKVKKRSGTAKQLQAPSLKPQALPRRFDNLARRS